MNTLRLPRTGSAREGLRERGQFWTPDWVADAMVTYVLGGGSQTLFCPAVGPGTFFAAARRNGFDEVRLLGVELHPEAFALPAPGLGPSDFEGVTIGDFLACARSHPIAPRFTPQAAIVANPPYIRHHRLSAVTKAELQGFARRLTGLSIDGRAGLHVYFLLRSLSLLAEGGRLAFILPADTFEGVFAGGLWKWIVGEFDLRAVITFAAEATPFPGVDTNAVVAFVERRRGQGVFAWAECLEAGDHLAEWVRQGFHGQEPRISTSSRTVTEGIATGLSRQPGVAHEGSVLADYASVMRGIATGANDFFFLTREEARRYRIPPDLLVPAIGRTRDLPVGATEVTDQVLDEIDRSGRPTLLFVPDGRPMQEFPPSVQEYLARGVRQGLPERPLIGIRRPWYKMETRRAPDFLFAYLGRRSSRFIRNVAGVVPLNGFHCVYAHDPTSEGVNELWALLSEPSVAFGLRSVGKSYGGGAIKVEPRGLDRLPLSAPARCRPAQPQPSLGFID